MEKVDILLPPDFVKSGQVKPITKAWDDEDWIGTFNLWIVQSTPIPAIVYQIRSLDSSWEPGKLDVTAGGHYSAGETIKDGLREVREELSKNYDFKKLKLLGKKITISKDTKNRTRNNIVDIFMIEDNSPLDSYVLEKSEVYAICLCEVTELLKVHSQKNYSFTTQAITNEGKKIKIKVTKDSFPKNFDNYHYKIAILADRFIKGKQHLVY